tara:strand:+ start:788 stop:1381 length:594 start_codon:yes stop_codon:yes gene_type:complete
MFSLNKDFDEYEKDYLKRLNITHDSTSKESSTNSPKSLPEESISLEVAAAYLQDIGNKIARVDDSVMQKLGFTHDEINHTFLIEDYAKVEMNHFHNHFGEQDFYQKLSEKMDGFSPLAFNPCIEIIGRRRTVARCRCFLDTEDHSPRSIIRFDNFERNNSGMGVGDTVYIKKIETVLQKKYFLKELEKIRIKMWMKY